MDASVENIPSSPTLISNRENKKNANVPDLNCVGGLSIATNQQSLAEQQGPGQLDILIREIAERGLIQFIQRGALHFIHAAAHCKVQNIFLAPTDKPPSLPPDWTVDNEAHALLP